MKKDIESHVAGVEQLRPYASHLVKRLRGWRYQPNSITAEMTSRLRASLLWGRGIRTLGAMTGHQAVQYVAAGLEAIYVSGWQVAADANSAGETYPDQSLYPVDSVPNLVRRINNAFRRQSEILRAEEADGWQGQYVPIVADAEAGFGGVTNVYELVRQLIDAGAAGIHLEDQLSSAKKCGHMGGKVLLPTSQAIKNLKAARLAADVMDQATVIIARTDADSAQLVTSDMDEIERRYIEYDQHYMPNASRTAEGFYRLKKGTGLMFAIERSLAYAPYADVLWMETSKPDLMQAKIFAEQIHEKFPGKPLAYNCSPSFDWTKMDLDDVLEFQDKLSFMGYKFQFVTLAGYHSIGKSSYELAKDYRASGMAAYQFLQAVEKDLQDQNYAGFKHQRAAGTGYFDKISEMLDPNTELVALKGSTEEGFDK